MGYRVFNKDTKCYSPKYNDGTIAPMQFDTSWDWLMPVIEKCKEVEAYDSAAAYHEVEDALLSRLSIEDTYQAVVEFINEHDVQLEKDIKNGLYGEQ